uniref:Uncharacterized protein n=1 Tax=uncultured marine virus TaxID=186617 RepID=A0A0F7L270_9VIRU|nr:hypothetical protein [uncultured marine virus]
MLLPTPFSATRGIIWNGVLCTAGAESRATAPTICTPLSTTVSCIHLRSSLILSAVRRSKLSMNMNFTPDTRASAY